MTFATWLIAAALATGVQDAPDDSTAAQTAPEPTLSLQAPVADSRQAGLLSRAGTYAAFHEDVDAAARRPLLSGVDLDDTMDALAAYYSDDRLVDAQIAYAALIAAQHPEYIDAVRSVADYYGADAVGRGIINDPLYITGFMGTQEASASVVDAISTDVRQIHEVGNRYRQASYDLQAEAWAQQRARDRAERLTSIETASSRVTVQFQAERPTGAITSRNGSLASASALYTGSAPSSAPLPDLALTVGEAALQPDERRTSRILSVAALNAIHSGDMDVMDALLNEPSVERCINWARLDLNQCVAAGHFKYEDAYCIAEHALTDVARCLTTARPAISN
jgi:hypothetical protein